MVGKISTETVSRFYYVMQQPCPLSSEIKKQKGSSSRHGDQVYQVLKS
jgi:hypothetical protein